MEAKGKDREEVEFFGKFILCSNNEDNFIQIDEEETRFWIIKVKSIKMRIQIIPYLYKERKKPLRAQVGKNVISFSQAEFTKLPKYMREDERIKFSTEQRQLLLNPEKKPSKFFMRWVDDAIFPDSIKEKMEEIKNR
jgi:hypothetical protein